MGLVVRRNLKKWNWERRAYKYGGTLVNNEHSCAKRRKTTTLSRENKLFLKTIGFKVK